MESAIKPAQVFCPVEFWNFADLMRAGGAAIGEESYAVHIWQEMWRRKGKEGAEKN